MKRYPPKPCMRAHTGLFRDDWTARTVLHSFISIDFSGTNIALGWGIKPTV